MVSERLRARRSIYSFIITFVAACRSGAATPATAAPHVVATTTGEVANRRRPGGGDWVPVVGVALATTASSGQLSATGAWRL